MNYAETTGGEFVRLYRIDMGSMTLDSVKVRLEKEAWSISH